MLSALSDWFETLSYKEDGAMSVILFLLSSI